MLFQKQIPSLEELLKIDHSSHFFLTEFHEISSYNEQIDKVKELVKKSHLVDLIVKLACYSPRFREICLREEFASNWLSWWSTYGILLTEDKQKALFAQPAQNEFDLFLGIYFYHKALVYSKQYGRANDFDTEKAYLERSMKYGSIHALQRYSRYLYKEIDSKKQSTEIIQGKLEKLITDIRHRLIPYYNSYAYLMLAEGYIYYGLLNPENAMQANTAALQACQHAAKVYKIDDPIIFNASLGGTLADSNTKAFKTPDEAERWIKNFSHDATQLQDPIKMELTHRFFTSPLKITESNNSTPQINQNTTRKS